MGYWKFVGEPGEFLAGVPGRDLSDADVDGLDPEARATLAEHLERNPHPIYEHRDEDMPAPEPTTEAFVLTEPAPNQMATNVAVQAPDSAEIPDASHPDQSG